MVSFKDIINRLIKDRAENTMSLLIEKASDEIMSDEDIAYLAKSMADSGKALNIGLSGKTADIASTGGPTSLSTLLCPLYLRAFGYVVPKLGVPGRPAGGIDVLAQIPGYKVVLDEVDIQRSLERSGYVHFLASDRYAPLDAELFAFRRKTNAIAMPALAIASILSKKLAVGVKQIGLDVRVAPHGNFGSSWDEARNNAMRFCRVATHLGLEAACFLTNGRIPYQPFVGRGESLMALVEFFKGRATGSLKIHTDTCFAMAASVAGLTGNEHINRPSPTDLFYHFEANLVLQGSDVSSFNEYVDKVKKKHLFDILSSREGFLHVDIGRLRDTIVDLQNQGISSEHMFPDPCGVILNKASGEYVGKGDRIASVRVFEGLWPRIADSLREALKIRSFPDSIQGFEEVTNG